MDERRKEPEILPLYYYYYYYISKYARALQRDPIRSEL
jgi:hypothetical protein